jgi:hypothetical protein
MSRTQRPSLPIEKFIHHEDVDMAPADSFLMGDFEQPEVLFDGADGKDPSRGFSLLIVGSNFVGHRPGHVFHHVGNVRKETYPNTGKLVELIHRHFKNFFESHR